MKKQIATFLITYFLIQTSLMAYDIELNTSYDYFRGIPDGSWNGNNGAYVSTNIGTCIFDELGAQLGGSYGLYNWDGRQNIVFSNSKQLMQQAFLTGGFFYEMCNINLGLVYDRMFTKHYGIFDANPSIDQLRFQTGYQWCQDEVGVWGTAGLTTDTSSHLGLNVKFQAISQLNLFWTHCFENSARTTVWLGAPYRTGLMNNKIPGTVTAGFTFRAPLCERLYLDGHGSYMSSRKASSWVQSRSYGASICVGITYMFGDDCCSTATYMPMANNSNFLMDTNFNL